MKELILASVSLFLFSCAHVKPLNEIDNEIMPLEPVHYNLQPGKVAYVKFPLPPKTTTNVLKCETPAGTQEYSFNNQGTEGDTYLAISYFTKIDPYKCYVNNGKEDFHILDIDVTEYPYPSEKLNVDQKRVDLSPEDQKRVQKEYVLTKNLYKDNVKTYLFNQPFKIPLDSFRTSIYGAKRLFNNKKQSQHLGNDFRAAVGTPIPVSNRGKVIFAGDLFYTGNVVIVDHGMGIFTNYAHLSKIMVEVGDVINQGEIVGLSGMTGRVTGPHLHWGVRIGGHHVDGFSLRDASLEQF